MEAGAKTLGSQRRADVDYLRVGALLLLIVYHVMLVYDSWDWWRVKSEYSGHWADFLVTAVTPWRMLLVFFVGGIAARFMLERNTTAGFIRDRAAKLLVAFGFAVIVLMPLQRYVRLDENGADVPSYLHYLLHEARYAVPYHGMWLPDFANAWFLPYLFIYSVAIVAFWRYAPKTFAALQSLAERTPIWIHAALLMAGLAIHQAVLSPLLPETRLVFEDFAAHARFVPVFLLGALIAKSDVFRRKLIASRNTLWLTAGLLLALALGEQMRFIDTNPELTGVPRSFLLVHGLYGGVALLSVVAFAAWALNRPSRGLTYATDAILPVYLMHQTVLVVFADMIITRGLPLALEMSALFAVTLLVPLAIYHFVIRNLRWMRVLFGLRPEPREAMQPREKAPDAEPTPLTP